MAQESALTNGNVMPRMRVHTPGKYVVLYLFVPVVLVALGAGIWLNVMSKRSAIAALEYRQSASGQSAAYFKLPEFLIDLAPDMNGRTAYLKIRTSVALERDAASKTAAEIETMQPIIVERLTFFLRELRPEDFQGSEGMERVKREMLRRVRLVVTPDGVDEIIIEELVIQ